ncbi:MAG: ABC transporter ATP-binding protein, partial [Acidimicrobiales bacterium]
GRTTAVSSLSISVGRGEVFGFLGPNGAGKTTAVKMLLGLVAPTAGEAMVLGAPAGDRETRRRIGYLPELFRYQPWLTAAEVLRLHCHLLRLPHATWPDATGASLHDVGLAGRAGDKVAGFSKGMQQRLGLAVALLGAPELVFLDEPTSALDPVGRHDVRTLIQRLRAAGTTVFLNTHLLQEAEYVCDRVAVMDRGTVIATGPLPDLIGRQSRVRLQARGRGADWTGILDRYGSSRREGEWTVIEGVDPEQVADLVDELVGAGVRVDAVVPEHHSLEERFLDLLGHREPA